MLYTTTGTVVKLNSEVVKLNSERKIRFKAEIRTSCIVAKCWKIAFHLKIDRKRGSLVVIAHWPLVLEVMGSIPAADDENFGFRTCFP